MAAATPTACVTKGAYSFTRTGALVCASARTRVLRGHRRPRDSTGSNPPGVGRHAASLGLDLDDLALRCLVVLGGSSVLSPSRAGVRPEPRDDFVSTTPRLSGFLDVLFSRLESREVPLAESAQSLQHLLAGHVLPLTQLRQRSKERLLFFCRQVERFLIVAKQQGHGRTVGKVGTFYQDLAVDDDAGQELHSDMLLHCQRRGRRYTTFD